MHGITLRPSRQTLQKCRPCPSSCRRNSLRLEKRRALLPASSPSAAGCQKLHSSLHGTAAPCSVGLHARTAVQGSVLHLRLELAWCAGSAAGRRKRHSRQKDTRTRHSLHAPAQHTSSSGLFNFVRRDVARCTSLQRAACKLRKCDDMQPAGSCAVTTCKAFHLERREV
jgi:hypothetical protein